MFPANIASIIVDYDGDLLSCRLEDAIGYGRYSERDYNRIISDPQTYRFMRPRLLEWGTPETAADKQRFVRETAERTREFIVSEKRFWNFAHISQGVNLRNKKLRELDQMAALLRDFRFVFSHVQVAGIPLHWFDRRLFLPFRSDSVARIDTFFQGLAPDRRGELLCELVEKEEYFAAHIHLQKEGLPITQFALIRILDIFSRRLRLNQIQSEEMTSGQLDLLDRILSHYDFDDQVLQTLIGPLFDQRDVRWKSALDSLVYKFSKFPDLGLIAKQINNDQYAELVRAFVLSWKEWTAEELGRGCAIQTRDPREAYSVFLQVIEESGRADISLPQFKGYALIYAIRAKNYDLARHLIDCRAEIEEDLFERARREAQSDRRAKALFESRCVIS